MGPHLFSPTVGSFNLLGLERGSNPNFFSFRVSRALTPGGRSIRIRPGRPLRGLQQTLDWRTRRHRVRYIHIYFSPPRVTMALNASYASPMADAQYALKYVESSGLLNRLTQGWSA